MKAVLGVAALCLAGLALGSPPAESPAVALRGALAFVGDGRTIANATLVVRGGRIESLASGKTAPASAKTIDLTGKRLYPGLIDALSGAALKPAKSDPDKGGTAQQARVQASELLDIGSRALDSWRAAGVLALNLAPSRGIFRGRTAIVLLDPETGPRVLRSPAAFNVSLQGLAYRNRVPGVPEIGGEFPTRLIGVFGFVRQTFLDAQRYAAAPAGSLPNDPDLDALRPVMRGELRVLLPGNEEREVRRVLDLSDDYKLRAILVGGYEAAQLGPELTARGIPVAVSLAFPQREADVHPDFHEPAAYLRYRLHAPRAAGELQRAGVRLAFASDGLASGREFLYNLRRAVREGLPRDAALRAATLGAAELFGVQKELGSLEVGKLASLVVTDGDLFDDGTRIEQVFVEGKAVSVPGAARVSLPAAPSPAPLEGPAAPKTPQELLIRNANVMTVSQGTLKGVSILVRDGKIAALGNDVKAPARAELLDGSGMWVTPGFIDCHSHIATDSHNESGANITSLSGIYDVLNPNDIAVYRTLAAGVTTANTLHGSVNVIGGKTVVTKTRFGRPVPELVFKGAKPGLKFAIKEFGARRGPTPPSSWMGDEAFLRETLTRAKRYARERQDWERGRAPAGAEPLLVPPRRDLTLEPLVEAMQGRRLVHVHSYTVQEMLLVMRVAEDFGFRVVLQHATEAYKIADEIKRHGGGGASIFADLGGSGDMIGVYNAAILTEKGVPVSINSDGEELARYFNQYAARALRMGGLDESQALALVTLNPAIQLQIDKQVGSIEVGKDADLVLFDKYPLSVYAVPQKVFIDGNLYWSRERETERVARARADVKRLQPLDDQERARFLAATGGAHER